MKEKVLIYPIKVQKKAEVKSFQIKLPTDAKTLIGIETTARDIDVLITPFIAEGSGGEGGDFPEAFYMKYVETYLAGELRLQSCEEANLFYGGDVWLTDNNLGLGDFSQTNSFRARPWTHAVRREEDRVRLKECCGTLQGTYRDRVGERLNIDAGYTVNLYLWYEIETDCNLACSEGTSVGKGTNI